MVVLAAIERSVFVKFELIFMGFICALLLMLFMLLTGALSFGFATLMLEFADIAPLLSAGLEKFRTVLRNTAFPKRLLHSRGSMTGTQATGRHAWTGARPGWVKYQYIATRQKFNGPVIGGWSGGGMLF
jgi:hypothetical protein